jgi:hypothetical protein
LVDPLVVCGCVLTRDVLTCLIPVLGCLHLFLLQMSIVESEQGLVLRLLVMLLHRDIGFQAACPLVNLQGILSKRPDSGI